MIIEGTHLEHWIDSITLEHMLGVGSIATAATPPKEKKRRSKKKTTTTTTNKKDSTM
tara:strand:+ start:447 stop:617 length:171 start_codon:yes stop_codon:yes gene_type:complete